MKPRSVYEHRLSRVVEFLKRRPATAAELAKHFNASAPTPYNWIRALRERGFQIREAPTELKRTGPGAVAYRIAAD